MRIPLAIYGSHDSSICIIPEPGKFRIYEFERITGRRNCHISSYMFEDYVHMVKDIIEKEYPEITGYTSCFFAQVPKGHLDILKDIFGFEHFEEISHHAAHAAGAAYQCDFQQCLVISSDSGGHEIPEGTIGTFCLFHVDKTRPMNDVVKKIADFPIDTAGAYTMIAIPIREVYKEDLYSKYLTYAGKVMGLAGYGNWRAEWTRPITTFYQGPINMEKLTELGVQIGLNLSTINTISGQDAYDLAATSQWVFEHITAAAIMQPILHFKLPVVLTGGAALNVLFNETLRRTIQLPVFVPANPNDCGLSFGMMCLRNPPEKTADITYAGFGILDIDDLDGYAERYKAMRAPIWGIASRLNQGKIVGVMHGNSECGPRALGHRSIFCIPFDKKMKDILNKKVKMREWFRPFAPVVRREDVNTFFEFDGESRFMSYAVKVRQDYWNSLGAIVHEDKTARVQTVTREQNRFLYDLLTEIEDYWSVGMLLNTSLNIKGMPILTTIKDAIHAWQSTEMDCLYIDGWLFEKQA